MIQKPTPSIYFTKTFCIQWKDYLNNISELNPSKESSATMLRGIQPNLIKFNCPLRSGYMPRNKFVCKNKHVKLKLGLLQQLAIFLLFGKHESCELRITLCGSVFVCLCCNLVRGLVRDLSSVTTHHSGHSGYSRDTSPSWGHGASASRPSAWPLSSKVRGGVYFQQSSRSR